MKNPFSLTGSTNWIIPVTLTSLVLGLMISMARITGGELKTTRLRMTEDQDLISRVALGDWDLQKKHLELQSEVNKLREEKTELENAVADTTKGTQALNNQLQEAKIVACLTDVEGPGVMVTLRDSKPETTGDELMPPAYIEINDSIIHDQDVLRVVNELWAAGAEAISINNIRLGATSSVRCVGPVVNVNGVKVAPPIKIRAIGDQATLVGALELPGGIVDDLKAVDPAMIEIERIEKMTLPAFAGPTTRRYAEPPPPSK